MLQMTVADIDCQASAYTVSKRIQLLQKDRELTFESEHLSRQGEVIPVEVMAVNITFNKQPAVYSAAAI